MLHHGLDFHTVRIICKNCGWLRNIAHSGCADGKRALVKITKSPDSSHVLHAEVMEVPEDIDYTPVLEKYPGFRDLVGEAQQKGLQKLEDEFLPLLHDQSCPRCNKTGFLILSQVWNLGSDGHPRRFNTLNPSTRLCSITKLDSCMSNVGTTP